MLPHPKCCLDATAGTGRDTLFLCELAGEKGQVTAMDIQEKAIAQTKSRLERSGYLDRVRLLLDGHEHMADYFKPESLDLVMFNLGYLPGGDHKISTEAETTLQALDQSLVILCKGGLLSLVVYSGGDSGFVERDAVLRWAKNLDSRQYLVIVEAFYNKGNHPPLPIFVLKLDI